MGRGKIVWLTAAAGAALLAFHLVRDSGLQAEILRWFGLVSDRQWIRAAVESYGQAAPLVFIGIQVAQVIAAPIPGEATGFIGGYIFGTLAGFVYSSIGLTIGSLINFGIGRFLGERFVRRLIPRAKFRRLDRLVNRQGILFILLMFITPGFPKDYLSLVMGLSTLPLKIFALLASVGRMPGTLLLSLQGASLYEKNYVLLGLVAAACMVLVLAAYRFRERLYRLADDMGGPSEPE
jgi:uncharacterized membrane protein YdjX (TVP38/TMEM64 family)